MSEPSLPEESIFAQALEIESTAERAAFLDRACGCNAALRAGVEALLRASRKSGDLLDLPENPAETTDLPAAERPGTVIGAYKLIETIGEGGMGTVYMAQQTEPVKRLVALKLIKPGMDSRQVIARFEAERQALALMDHPNIARVFDGGTTKGEPGGVSPGRPYFVMELVKGVPLTKYCDEHRLAPRQRLELFVPVCQAIQHAHQKGIIHRDIKPSNVLVALYDGKPVPKVIDFGVAKATGQQLTERTLVTGFGAVVGTLEYMSPEQAELNQLDIDTRSDIYSLGVLLYELLTGTTPLDKKRLKQAALMEVLRLIREEEPPRPSTRLSTTDELPSVAANRGLEPKKLSGLVRGELDWIVMKALDKDRNRRYETANGFAMDIQRYLADEPVLACPPSAWYRFRKMARRNKAAMTMVAMFTLALLIAVAALSVSTVLTSRAYDAEKAAHDRAEANFQRTRQAVHDFFTTVSQSKLLDVPGVQPVRQELLESAVRYYQALAKERDDDPIIQAELALAHLQLAEVYYEVGKNSKAIASVDAGLDLADQLIQDHPDDRELLRRLAGFCKATRMAAEGSGAPGPDDLLAAERSMNRFIRLWQTLSDRDTSERLFRSDLAAAYYRLGQLLDTIAWHHPAGAQRRPEAMVAAEKAADMWDALIRAYPKEPEYLLAQSETCSFLKYLARVAGQHQRESEFSRRALKAAEKLAAMNPTAPPYRQDIANALMGQAGALRAQNKPAEAEKQYRRALAIWDKLAHEYPMNSGYRLQIVAACGSLAELLRSIGQRDEAERFDLRFAEGLDDAVANLPADPRSGVALVNMIGDLAFRIEDAKNREKLFRRAVEIYAIIMPRFPDDVGSRDALARSHHSLGDVMAQKSQPKEAVKQWLREVAIREKLPADFKQRENREALAWAHSNLAVLLRNLNQPAESEEHYRRAFAMWDKLLAEYPLNRAHLTRIAVTCVNLAKLLRSMGQADEAERFHLRLAEILDNAVANAREPESASELADVIGQVAFLIEEAPQRETLVQRAVAILEKLRDRGPGNANYELRLAWLHADYGKLIRQQPKLRRDAEKHFRDAAVIIEKLAARAPANAQYQEQLRDRHGDLIDLLSATGQQKEIAKVYQWDVDFYEKLTAQFPKVRAYQLALSQSRGRLHRHLGEWDKAIADYSEAIKLEPKRWESWSERGGCQLNLHRWDKSIEDYTEAIKLAPDVHTNWHHRGLAYAELGQWDKVVNDRNELLKRFPNDYNAFHFRAVAYVKLKQLEKAVADLRQAFAKGYKDLEAVKKDERFAPLRNRDDFKKLLAELEAKKGK